jgi:hypothetical protein
LLGLDDSIDIAAELGRKTIGGTSGELKYGKAVNAMHSIDVDNLTFAALGSYNIEVGSGFVGPVFTGGAGYSMDVYIDPIP